MKNALLFLALLAIAGCKKKDGTPDLPALTHQGKNIIAWKLDGKIYISEGLKSFRGYRSFYTVQTNGIYGKHLVIQAQAHLGGTSTIELNMQCIFNDTLNKPLKMAGDYPIQGDLYDFSNPDGGTAPTAGNTYSTDSLRTGAITVTYYDGDIIAGTFQMEVVNSAGQVRRITDGRFDIAKQ